MVGKRRFTHAFRLCPPPEKRNAMSMIQTPIARHPSVPFRAVPLSAAQAETQIQRGLYHVERGERLAIPVDRLSTPTVFLNRELWRQDASGRVFRPGARMAAPGTQWQGRTLAWLRDHVNKDIPSLYYRALLGHDLHVSTWGTLSARHFHNGWANPFNPDKVESALNPAATHDCDKPDCPLRGTPLSLMSKLLSTAGFVEDLGWLSSNKVTQAFVAKECDELEGTGGGEYADFDNHEVGTSNQAESNADTALIATSGIARVAGTPSSTAVTYVSVGTVTADTSETWQEHGLFCNTTGPTLLDRSLTGGQAVNNLDQVQYTYTLTKAYEA